jgi:hypothetical protein
MSTPTRRIRSVCCARAGIGHATAEQAIPLMKSRRRIASPDVQEGYRTNRRQHSEGVGATLADVRFGSKADICTAVGHVCFTPESDIKCDIWIVR